MAKNQKDLKGWKYILIVDGDNTDPISTSNASNPKTDKSSQQIINDSSESRSSSRRSSRRSQRGETTSKEPLAKASNNLKLKRESDDLQIEVGDCVLVQEKDTETPTIAIIKEITFGVQHFIDVVATWFIRMPDVEFEDLPKEPQYSQQDALSPNEIFITSYNGELFAKQIIDKVSIVSSKEFTSDIILDESNSSNTFMCRRGCDQFAEIFTDEFDFRSWHDKFKLNPLLALEIISNQTIPKAYKPRSTHEPSTSVTATKNKVSSTKTTKEKKSTKSAETTPAPTKKGRGRPRKTTPTDSSNPQQNSKDEDEDDEANDDSDDDSDDDEVSNKSSDDEENLDDESDEEAQVDEDSDVDLDFGDRPTAKKRQKKELQRTPAKLKQKRASTNASPSKTPVLGSLKKRFKVKPEISKSSLPDLSPRKSNSSRNIPRIDPSSEAFRKLKAELHTSARLAKLPGRDNEYAEVWANLASAIEEETGCCVYVSGTPGVGKTATIRSVIDDLLESKGKGELSDFDFLEINGLKLLTPNVAYEKLWEKVSGYKVSASNAALLLEDYFKDEKLDKKRKPLVVLMDELDQLVTAKQNVMYNFFNWPTYTNSKLIVIAVANTMDLPERVLSNKISSRLGLRRIQFIGYTFQQLEEIIIARLTELTKNSKRNVTLEKGALGIAARKVASVSGDARRALTICRRAVEIAEQEYLASKDTSKNDDESINLEEESYSVVMNHILRAINETVNSPTSQFLVSLPFASKLVLVGVLLRMKRSGLAGNTLGDIIDEIKNSLSLITTRESNKALEKLDPRINFMELLYGNNLFQPADIGKKTLNIRLASFKHIVTELVENGILIEQAVRSERHRLISLNVSEDEVLTVLKKDKDVSGMV